MSPGDWREGVCGNILIQKIEGTKKFINFLVIFRRVYFGEKQSYQKMKK